LDGYTAINRSPEPRSLISRMYHGQERLAWGEMHSFCKCILLIFKE
jgi:hypothetical protein